MATRDEIYTAIRNADKAGDSAAVRKLGDYLKTLPPEGEAKPLDASSTHEMAVKAANQPSLAMAPVGAAEVLAKGATGALASIPAGLAYGGAAIRKAFGADVNPADVQRRVQNYLTYEPVSDSAKAAEQAFATTYGPAVRAVGNVADQAATAVGKVSPTAETFLREAPAAAQAAGAVVPFVSPAIAAARQLPGAIATGARATASGAAAAGRKVAQAGEAASDATVRAFGGQPAPSVNPIAPVTAQSVLDQQAANSGQSMGAAAAAPRVTGASPPLQQAIVREAQKNGGAVNLEATNRQLNADSLPVKVSLTEGQALRDPALFSEEQNLRGKHAGLAEHFNTQNSNLVKNVQAVRDEIGPDVFSTNHVEHADTLIKGYEDLDAGRNADITQKYQALRDAAGGKFPVDAKTLLDNSRTALAKELLTHDAPPGIMRTLGDLADSGQMTFEQFENLRTNLARIQRNFSTDGNTRFAAGLIRDQMEQLPLEPGAASLKPLADAARGAARERFQALEADPAYKAAVNGTVPPDKFVKKFVIGGNRDDVATMAQNLAGNDTARQTMAVSVLDHLRDAAGVGADYKGSFKQSGWNRALASLDPKLQSLVNPKTAETLQNIGTVAHDIQVPPPGHTVNSSNTLTAGLSDYAEVAAEHAVNAHVGLPVGTVGRKIIQNVKYGARVKQAIQPGAGIGKLSDLAPAGRQAKGVTPLSALSQSNAPR